MNYTKAIERANEGRQHFAELYDVGISNVIWCGNDKFIVCKDDQEIRIGFNM